MVHLAVGDQPDEPTALRFGLPAVELKRAQRQGVVVFGR